MPSGMYFIRSWRNCRPGLAFGRIQVRLELGVEERAAEGPEHAREAVGRLGLVALGLQRDRRTCRPWSAPGRRRPSVSSQVAGGLSKPASFEHAGVVEQQARIVVEGQAVDRAVPARRTRSAAAGRSRPCRGRDRPARGCRGEGRRPGTIQPFSAKLPIQTRSTSAMSMSPPATKSRTCSPSAFS